MYHHFNFFRRYFLDDPWQRSEEAYDVRGNTTIYVRFVHSFSGEKPGGRALLTPSNGERYYGCYMPVRSCGGVGVVARYQVILIHLTNKRA